MEKISKVKKRLRKIREDNDLTRPQLSEATGIPRATIEGWEIRKNNPNLEQLIILADYYNVSLDYITCRTNNPQINY